MGWSRVGVTSCLIVAGLATGPLAAPDLQAQEVEPPLEGTKVEEPRFDLRVGLRGELHGVPSPGVSVDLALNGSRSPVWVSVQYLAQMVRWNVQYDDLTRRDHYHLGRVRLGLGRGEGPSIYGLFEKGFGVIMMDRPSWRGRSYDLTGMGLGAGLTVRRVTVSFEVVLGVADRSSPDLYGGLGLALQYRLWGFNP